MKRYLKVSNPWRLMIAVAIVAALLVTAFPFAPHIYAEDEPGVATEGAGLSEDEPSSITINPVITETGFITLSIDGLGTITDEGIIEVEKPSGATVRSAYLAAASTGFNDRQLVDGDVKINGVDVVWDMATPASISCWNHWADVTSIVKPTIDAAPAGRVACIIQEVETHGIDGELLVVIFNDPNQTTSNTVVLLFGAQDINGDTFNVGLAEPLDLSDPNLILDMSLGISYGYQTETVTNQVTLIDVNGIRLTSSAGGYDDGVDNNGALLTAGGLDDSNANPDPSATPAGVGSHIDDELYDLIPFVDDGDTSISVFTQNPSMDDNIFFAAFYLASTTAIVGEGIVLAPSTDTNPLDTQHTVTATVQDDDGNPVVDRDVTFLIISGPHAGQTSTVPTDANGKVSYTYMGTTEGTDIIEASFVDSYGQTQTSNQVEKTWILPVEPPTVVSVSPNSGEQGSTLEVAIGGTNFVGATAVSFGDGITVNSFTVVSATQITANSSISATATLGPRDVSVTTPDGTGTLADGFTVVATGVVTISIDAPDEAAPDSDFTANVNISEVTNFDACNYDVSFDASVLRLDDVTSGLIGSTTIPVDMYNEIGSGTYRVVQNVPGLSGVSGTGYLVVLHFHVIGSEGDSSAISLSNGMLANNLAEEIPATWTGDTVNVTSVLPGDANGDGNVNALDIVKVERIIAGLDAETPGADANQDGSVNALDIVKIERIIAGLD